jgi:hypothetical protein
MGMRLKTPGATFIVLVFSTSLVCLALFAVGASGAPVATVSCPPAKTVVSGRGFLIFTVCGPRDVTLGNYSYTVVLTNAGHVSSGKVKLSAFHADPITRSSIPYRESSGRAEFGMYDAVWALGNLAPGHSFRVTITVSFRQHKRNSGFTELVLRAAGQRVGAGGGAKKDVFFK